MKLAAGSSESFELGTIHVAPPAPAVIFVSPPASTKPDQTDADFLGNTGYYAEQFFSPDVDTAAYTWSWVSWPRSDSQYTTFREMINGYTKTDGIKVKGVIEDIEDYHNEGLQVVLIGASWGADVALDAARQTNLPVKDLILFDPIDVANKPAPELAGVAAGTSVIDLHRNLSTGFELQAPTGEIPIFPRYKDGITNLLIDPAGFHPWAAVTPSGWSEATAFIPGPKYNSPSTDYTIQFVENAILGQPLFPENG
jgi:pimeloyl-ACP methyl ester carboxylesterase